MSGETPSIGTGPITVNGGTFITRDRASALTLANNLSLAGPRALYFLNTGATTLTGTVALTGDTTIDADAAFQSGDITITQGITGTGNVTFFGEGGDGTHSKPFCAQRGKCLQWYDDHHRRDFSRPARGFDRRR